MAMTEAEWRACADPEPMLALLDGRVAEVDLRRFAIVCCRRFIDRHPSEQRHRALALAQQMVDDPGCTATVGLDDVDTTQRPADCACDAACLKDAMAAAINAPFHAQRVIWHTHGGDMEERLAAIGEEQQAQAELLRQIVGYPLE
jgi:hypothetical protein